MADDLIFSVLLAIANAAVSIIFILIISFLPEGSLT